MSGSLQPDCSPPGSSVHGALQARILEWAAILFSRGSSRPRDQTWVSRITGRFSTIWATREAPKVARLVLKTRQQVHFLIEPNLGLLVRHKANLLPLACGEEKHSVHHKAPHGEPGKENRLVAFWPLAARTPQWLSGKCFEGQGEEKAAECLISSWTFFWLVRDKVTGNQYYQPCGSNYLGSRCLRSACR